MSFYETPASTDPAELKVPTFTHCPFATLAAVGLTGADTVSVVLETRAGDITVGELSESSPIWSSAGPGHWRLVKGTTVGSVALVAFAGAPISSPY